jgi:hypothetical protein
MNPDRVLRFRQITGPIALAAGVSTVAMLASSALSVENPLMWIGLVEIVVGLILIGIRPIGRPSFKLFSLMIGVAVLAFLFLVFQTSSVMRFVVAVSVVVVLRLELALIWSIRELFRKQNRLRSAGLIALCLSLPPVLLVGVGLVDTLLYRLQQAREWDASVAKQERLAASLPVGDPQRAEHLLEAGMCKQSADYWYDSAWHILRPDERTVVQEFPPYEI